MEERSPEDRCQDLGSLVWEQGSRGLFGTESFPLAAWAEKNWFPFGCGQLVALRLGLRSLINKKKARHHVSGLNSKVADCNPTSCAIRKTQDKRLLVLL